MNYHIKMLLLQYNFNAKKILRNKAFSYWKNYLYK